MKSIKSKEKMIDCFQVGDLKDIDNIILVQDFLDEVLKHKYYGIKIIKAEKTNELDVFLKSIEENEGYEKFYNIKISKYDFLDYHLIKKSYYAQQGDWILVDENQKITILYDDIFKLYYKIIDEK